MKGIVFCIAFTALFLGSAAAYAEAQPFDHTGMPLPRFASLASDEINVRTGPGLRYPVEWVYTKKNLPVEIIREFDHWREIRDIEGQTGWIHKSLLSGRKSFVVTGRLHVLRKKPGQDKTPVAQVEAGVIGLIDDCREGWCKVEIAGYEGWLPLDSFWGGVEKTAEQQAKAEN